MKWKEITRDDVATIEKLHPSEVVLSNGQGHFFSYRNKPCHLDAMVRSGGYYYIIIPRFSKNKPEKVL